MNERIRELESQCWEPRQYGPAWFDSEKFAHLIVKECVSIVDGMADPEEDSDRYFWAIENASHEIKKHFGVRE